MQFNKLRLLHPDMPPVTTGTIAVLDFGSSAANLTVYDVSRYQHGYYRIIGKTKVDTAAGTARAVDGDFSLGAEVRQVLDEAVEHLLKTLEEYQPQHVVATATSVFRDAQDGPAWCNEQLEKRGWLINLIDGHAEAKLSAIGALSNMTHCTQGVVIDQGGGSLEIYNIATGACASYPFGVWSLMKLADGSAARAAKLMEETFRRDLPWLADTPGDLVTVGRAMRLIGNMMLGDDTRDKFTSCQKMLVAAGDIATGKIDPAYLKDNPGYETRLPYRGAVLQAVLNASQLERVRFADYALREGIFLTQTGREPC